MAFNNLNNPRELFPMQHQGNLSGMQAIQPTGVFQLNQPYGIQQNQGFPGSFPSHQVGMPMGPQINPQMRPQMGSQMNLPIGPQMGPQMRPQIGPQMRPQTGPQMTPQMGLQMGAFPSNVQLGHQFPKQQQKLIDQQRKQAEEQLKKQQELMKKKQFEAEKRKLQQSFTVKKPSNADALNNLFGKNSKGASDSSMTDLIGSLGSKGSSKPSASTLTGIFSRPGGSVAGQLNLTTGQWGSGYITSGPVNSQGAPASMAFQMHDRDDFGDFSQGPPPDQPGTFSDFHIAQPSAQFGVTNGSFPVMGSNVSVHPQASGGSSVFSQTQAWHSTSSGTTATSSATQQSFPFTQNISTASSVHGDQTTQHHMANIGAPSAVSWAGRSSVTQGGQMIQFSGGPTITQTSGILGMPTHGGQMTHFMDEITKKRAGSVSEFVSNVSGNAPAGLQVIPHPETPHNPAFRSQPLPASTHVGPQTGGFDASVSQPGGVHIPFKGEPNVQQVTERGSSSEPIIEPVPELDDSPVQKLELLYGVALPDWCVNGTHLPGVYKEIAERTTDTSDTIDTNRLFPILMASDLPRDQLGHIWNKANKAVPGQLNALELRIVLGLVALAQAGMKTERLTLEKLASCKAAPIPTIPESVLQTRGRGWSFTESSQTSGITEGSAPFGHHSSTSSDHSIDPDDRYSVFRTIDKPETTSLASSSSIDSRDDFGVFKSGDLPGVAKLGSQTSEFSAFQGGISQLNSGWSRTGTSGFGGANLPNQQQDFGNFQSVPSQNIEEDAFGDFQGQSSLNNQFNVPGPSNLGHNLREDDFGDFQSKDSLHGGTPVRNQKNSETEMPDLTNVHKGIDWGGSSSSSLNVSDIAKTKLPKDDFADFQSGNEPEAVNLTLASIQPPKQQQPESLPGIGNLHFVSKLDSNIKSSGVVGSGSRESVSTTTNQPAVNFDTKGLTTLDDFGDFQHSPDPFSSNKTFAGFNSDAPEKPVSSLEKFKLSGNVFSSATQEGVNTTNHPVKHRTDVTKQDMTADLSLSAASDQSKAKVEEDKYSAFRDADFGSGGGIFSVQKPPLQPTPPSATAITTSNDQLVDHGFADFGSFEAADQFTSGDDSDFGAFKSPETAQNTIFRVTSDSQPASQDIKQDFGVFESASSNISNTTSESVNSADFGAFNSFSAGSSTVSNRQPNAAANARDSLINSVSLEPTERYKVLSHDSGEIDQHAHAWGRCLNSCLLTLATATLAIQKITEQSVKEEVMESKEGTTYFSAIVEIYRVTLRIKASINKAAPNNTKLQNIYQEIQRTWKDISGFLSGSDLLPSKSSLDFTSHGVSPSEDGNVACGICLLNVNKTTSESSKHGDSKLTYGGRHYHSTCANFWCNRVDSVLPSLLPIDSLI